MNHSPNKLGMYRLKTETKMRSKEVYTKVKKVVEKVTQMKCSNERRREMDTIKTMVGRKVKRKSEYKMVR